MESTELSIETQYTPPGAGGAYSSSSTAHWLRSFSAAETTSSLTTKLVVGTAGPTQSPRTAAALAPHTVPKPASIFTCSSPMLEIPPAASTNLPDVGTAKCTHKDSRSAISWEVGKHPIR